MKAHTLTNMITYCESCECLHDDEITLDCETPDGYVWTRWHATNPFDTTEVFYGVQFRFGAQVEYGLHSMCPINTWVLKKEEIPTEVVPSSILCDCPIYHEAQPSIDYRCDQCGKYYWSDHGDDA